MIAKAMLYWTVDVHTQSAEKKWMQDYIETLSENDQNYIKIIQSNQSFTFGDGNSSLYGWSFLLINHRCGGCKNAPTLKHKCDGEGKDGPQLWGRRAKSAWKVYARKKIKSGNYAIPLSMLLNLEPEVIVFTAAVK